MTGKPSGSTKTPGRWGWGWVQSVQCVRRAQHERRLCRVQSVRGERRTAKRGRGQLVQRRFIYLEELETNYIDKKETQSSVHVRESPFLSRNNREEALRDMSFPGHSQLPRSSFFKVEGMIKAYVYHIHVLKRGHVATLCCTNSHALFVSFVHLFLFLDGSVLFSPIKMPVKQMISSQVMNAAEYCVLVEITASWLMQPFAGAAGSKWGVSHQSSYMIRTFRPFLRVFKHPCAHEPVPHNAIRVDKAPT